MTLRRVQILVPTGGGGGGGDVDRERLIREGLEPFPMPDEFALVRARLLQDETFPELIEDTIVAAALIALETPEPPVDSPTIDASISEVAPLTTELATLVAFVNELVQNPIDSATIGTHISETLPLVTDSQTIEFGTMDSAPVTVESAVLVTHISELVQNPIDAAAMISTISEGPVAPIDSLNLSVASSTDEAWPETIDLPTFRTFVSDTMALASESTTRTAINGVYPAGVVVSQSNVTNPNNVLDNDADEATVVATASGIGGITSVTVNYSLIVSFNDFAITWLDIFTLVTLTVRYRVATGGVPIGAAQNVSIDYSMDDGAVWNNFWVGTTQQALSDINIDLITPGAGRPAIDGTNDWGRLNGLRVRVAGSITSGTGLGATNTLGIPHIKLALAVEKTI